MAFLLTFLIGPALVSVLGCLVTIRGETIPSRVGGVLFAVSGPAWAAGAIGYFANCDEVPDCGGSWESLFRIGFLLFVLGAAFMVPAGIRRARSRTGRWIARG
jgi:hypothetical protein